MNPQLKPRLTPEDYLAIERSAEFKSEYFDGEIFAMAGASRAHNSIVLNTGSEIRQHLKNRSCKAYVNDMRVKVSPTGLYTYPDVVVVCGKEQFEDTHLDTLLTRRSSSKYCRIRPKPTTGAASSSTTAIWTRWSNTC